MILSRHHIGSHLDPWGYLEHVGAAGLTDRGGYGNFEFSAVLNESILRANVPGSKETRPDYYTHIHLCTANLK